MSETHTWETPQDFFDALNAEFHFTLDAAASAENAKCERFYTYQQNGLAQRWQNERVWLNPPYGSDLPRWVQKAVTEPSEVTVMLIPARTETKWWGLFWDHEKHRPIGGCEVRFIKGRLKFGGGQGSAPFPSAVIIFERRAFRIGCGGTATN